MTVLEENLKRARAIAFEPPALYADGNEWRRYTPAELSRLKEEIVRRAEVYARWRYQAFLDGRCVSSW